MLSTITGIFLITISSMIIIAALVDNMGVKIFFGSVFIFGYGVHILTKRYYKTETKFNSSAEPR